MTQTALNTEKLVAIARKHRLATLVLFGSHARGEASAGSDVDLYASCGRPITLFDWLRVQQEMEEALGCPVDLAVEEAVTLHAAVCETMRRDGIVLYGEQVAAGPLQGERSMPPTDRERLQPMQQAAMRLLAAIADYDYEQYTQDWEKQAVVERMLEIIGEAASRLSPPLKQRYPEVPWGEAMGMRNIVSHEDWPIKNQLVWETATEEVGPLLRQLDRILQQIEDLPGTDR